jgi:hypothetical protein
MQTFLHHDEASGELRLVMTDLWDGQHERTEFRVINSDGTPVRQGAELDGQQVYGRAGSWYIKPMGHEMRVNTLPGERAVPTRTPCPKAENRRRKCALCA